MTNETSLSTASEKNLDALRGFLAHLTVYLGVNAIFPLLGLMAGAGAFWNPGTLYGWGIGLVFHGLGVALGLADGLLTAAWRAFDRR